MENPLGDFSIETQGLDTSYPLLPEGDYPFQIVESIRKPNKDSTGFNWHIQFNLTQPATAVDNREIKPNFALFSDAPMQAKADAKDPEWFRKNIAGLQDGIFGSDKSNRPAFTAALMQSAVGKNVICTVKLEQDTRTGGHQNRITKIRPA